MWTKIDVKSKTIPQAKSIYQDIILFNLNDKRMKWITITNTHIFVIFNARINEKGSIKLVISTIFNL